MALDAVDAAAQINAAKTAETGAPATTPKTGEPTGQSRTFNRNEFIVSESTGREVDRRGNKGKEIGQEKVALSAELSTQYENFLSSHVVNLLKLPNPQILDNPSHSYEKRLIQMLVTDGRPDQEKIKSFLNQPEGWMIATQIIERQTALKMFALGLNASINPDGNRDMDIDHPQTIRYGIDQGALNRFIHDRVVPFLTHRYGEVDGRRGPLSRLRRWHLLLGTGASTIVAGGVGGGVGALLGGTEGALAGELIASSGVAGLEAAGYGLAHILRNGLTLDLRQCADTLNYFQGQNPQQRAEAAYLKSVLGIDVGDYVVNGGQVQRRTGARVAVESVNPRQTQEELLQGLFVREEFYRQLGVPREMMDALPEQHLYHQVALTGNQSEQTGARWQKRVLELFNPNGVGIAPNDIPGNLRRYNEARVKVINEMVEEMAIRLIDGKQSTQTISSIDQKISDRGESGAERARRTKSMSENKTRLEREKQGFAGRKANIDSYEQARRETGMAAEEYDRYQREVNGANPDINLERQRLLNELNNSAGNPNSVASRRTALQNNKNASRVAAIAQAVAEIQARLPAGANINSVSQDERKAIERSYVEAAMIQYQAEDQAINDLKSTIEGQLAQVDNIIAKQRQVEAALRQKGDTIIAEATENLATVENNFNALTSLPGGAPALTDMELRSLTIDQLLARVNALSGANAGYGWSADQNNNPTNRAILIDAISEAKARYEEQFDTAKPARDADYNAVIALVLTPPITADQLRTLPRTRLAALTAPLGITPAQLDNAIAEARNRMILRHNGVINTAVDSYDQMIKSEEAAISAVNFDRETEDLRMIRDVMVRQGKIFEFSFEVAANAGRYTDRTAIDPNDQNYSNSEKTHNGNPLPVGYWQLMNAVFDYQGRTDRAEYAGKILRILPPDELNRRISVLLGRNQPYADLNTALTRLRTRLNNNTLSNVELRGMFRNIINDFRDRAKAI